MGIAARFEQQNVSPRFGEPGRRRPAAGTRSDDDVFVCRVNHESARRTRTDRHLTNCGVSSRIAMALTTRRLLMWIGGAVVVIIAIVSVYVLIRLVDDRPVT